MARYIDADVCLNAMLSEMVGTGYQSRAMDVIKFSPTADVVEVVRCKNCIYWDNASNWTPECRRLDGLSSPNEDDFCSYGTTKERGGEK
jgi:hypothetical protein